ncbi:MAG: alpha-1,4 polygalactosaminidase [Chitinophagaceae bacterium]|nr:alpha-1,4 polygalactosaminidase [Chitinophagaceae bacterium]
MAEVIEIQNNADNANWNPFVGEETNELLRSKGFANPDRTLNENGVRVLDETYRIMQVCGNPNTATNSETGIVIGYVQSGKTLSFTTLTALARDNNYQIVIIIGGTSVNLLDQSTKRVRKDLRIDSRYGFEQKWTQITNPHTQEDFDTITNALDQWANPTFPNNRCRTILITVMKNGSHLRNLADLINGTNLNGVPTLIIDDEGDHASLNTRARWAARQGIDVEDLTENEVSTIYRRITALRNIFPHHTFLQYTATPQANLFINIMDRLSPNFIKLLTPGDEYTGGIQFFRENPNLIREIPLNNIPNANQQLQEPPDSLLEALQVFYLGVVAGTVLELFRLPSQRNRSMLVHPSRLQGDHTTFYGWVNTIKESWRRLLSGSDEEEKADLLRDFRTTYNDLQMTAPDLPAFEALTDYNLVHAIQYTPIVEVNSRRGATPQINWQDSYSWILVGGQSMDRGFTVEGLTVTYMPRNVGVGNVDTIQQRARFFGYKRSYLGYCRVFLDQVTIDAYNFIVEHEEDVRNRLVGFDVSNRHLNDWDREAVLDQMLNLTRANILYDGLDRDRFGDDWYRINAPHDTENLIQSNSTALFDFLNPKSAMFAEDEGHANRTQEQKHLVARISMRVCLDHLLNKLKYTRESDSATYSSLRGILKGYLDEHPDDDCLVYLMSANSLEDWTRRTRRLDRNDEIQQLFQGRNPRTGEVIYPGDSEIKNENLLTIQIHLLNIRDTDFTSVPTLAIWVPEHIGRDIIRQA